MIDVGTWIRSRPGTVGFSGVKQWKKDVMGKNDVLSWRLRWTSCRVAGGSSDCKCSELDMWLLMNVGGTGTDAFDVW